MMNQDRGTLVAENSIELAREYVVRNNFGRAFSHYLVALHLKPEWKSLLKDEFPAVLCQWGTVLERDSRIQDLFKSYKQALEIFPNNEILLNNLGAHLLRCELVKEAAVYFHQCLSVNPLYIRAKHNLELVAAMAVERWHFRMLNDVHRNSFYKKAIITKIKQGCDTVLDIGTGTGLLSLFCFEGGASKIYACDSSPVMIEIAQEVFSRHNASKVNLISKHSTQLHVPSDIPGKVSLVITETFDSGLFGERILETLSHAWANLLLPPTSLHSNKDETGKFGYVLPAGANVYVTGIECDSISNRFYPKLPELFNSQCGFLKCEKYDTQDLRLVQYRILTDTEKMFTVDFNDPVAIEELLIGNKGEKEIGLRCIRAGRLDCFALWFDLILDEDTVLNTGPDSAVNEAWDQAIFPLPTCIDVRDSQQLSIKTSFKSGQLNLELKHDDLISRLRPFKPSKKVIKSLNNRKMVKCLLQTANKLNETFSRSLEIMDWFHFPIFGLNFLKMRKNKFKDKLTCLVSSEEDKQFIDLVVKEFALENCVITELEEKFEKYFIEKRKFDVIAVNLIETSGELRENCVLQLENVKSLLKPDGVFIPEEVTVFGQFVHSDWLLKASAVETDESTLGYTIGRSINRYKVQHFVDLEFGIEKTPLSHEVELFTVPTCNLSQATVIEKCLSSLSKTNNSVNAIIYWFQIKFIQGCDEMSTNEPCSTFNQSAFLFDKEINDGDQFKFVIIYNDGIFNIELS